MYVKAMLENGQRRKQSNSLFKLGLEDMEKRNSNYSYE